METVKEIKKIREVGYEANESDPAVRIEALEKIPTFGPSHATFFDQLLCDAISLETESVPDVRITALNVIMSFDDKAPFVKALRNAVSESKESSAKVRMVALSVIASYEDKAPFESAVLDALWEETESSVFIREAAEELIHTDLGLINAYQAQSKIKSIRELDDFLPKDFGNVLAKLDGRKQEEGNKLRIANGVNISDVVPGLGGSRIRSSIEIGQYVEGKGVYCGAWKPTHDNGSLLGKVFNLYAAPEDLSDAAGNSLPMTFSEACDYVSKMTDWYGHDGGDYNKEKAITFILEVKPQVLSDWFIPTFELLYGSKAPGDEITQHNHLLAVNDEMLDENKLFADLYWSSTLPPEHEKTPWRVSPDGEEIVQTKLSADSNNNYKACVRPVRAELRL